MKITDTASFWASARGANSTSAAQHSTTRSDTTPILFRNLVICTYLFLFIPFCRLSPDTLCAARGPKDPHRARGYLPLTQRT